MLFKYLSITCTLVSISSLATSTNSSNPFAPTIYRIAIIATTNTYITFRFTFSRWNWTTKAFITWKSTSQFIITSITICATIAITIASQAPSATCTTSSTATITTTSTATIATSTIRRTAIATTFVKNIFVNDFLFWNIF